MAKMFVVLMVIALQSLDFVSCKTILLKPFVKQARGLKVTIQNTDIMSADAKKNSDHHV